MAKLHFRPAARRLVTLSSGLGLAFLVGCGSGGSGGAGESRDAEQVVLLDRPLPDVGRLEPDVPALRDCVEGDERPCGSETGECSGGIEHCRGGLWDGVCEGENRPAEERCNGLDDDCDGSTDEDFRVNVTCKFTDARGIQRDGIQQCDPETGGVTCVPGMDCRDDRDADGYNVCEDCDDTDPDSHPDAVERCDGLDNDCNTFVDETFPLDEACVSGLGVCRRGGRHVCGEDLGLACDAVPAPPAPAELCGNGEDDDCDGETDEGYDVGAGCTAGVGVCAVEGRLACSGDGLAVVCDAEPRTPAEELCGNGLDDDCDGESDEDFELGAGCVVGLGACERAGMRLCDAVTGAVICSVAPGLPSPELCGNRVDDDCDGETDEGYEVGSACSAGEGECRRNGVTICARDGRSTACSAEAGVPHDELCGTDVDEDCDGLVDEDFDVGILCTAGLGECARLGVTECTLNRQSVLCAADPGAPALETCDGLDNDCDGETDEGFDVGAACSEGVGACRREGTIGCDLNGDLYCRAQPAPPGLERCGNGEDDDCDGQTDEGFDVGEVCTSGRGQCTVSGRRVCTLDGLDTTCDAVAGAARPEICGNLLDEDCDGTSDEGFDVWEACQVGLGACRRQGNRVCSPDGSTTQCSVVPGVEGDELCGTGIDEDCDGLTDEGYDVGAACSVGQGECLRRGQRACAPDGLSTVCAAVPGNPAVERCDGLDNNCNGAVDEGFGLGGACTSGSGRCAVAGRLVCRADGGAAVCDAVPLPPEAERCDGIDNDCDGSVDEDFPDLEGPCDAVTDPDLCALGAWACDPETGGQVCVGDIPTPEVCDYLDNDCDDVADNGYDLESDENNCGGCGVVCPAPFGTCIRAICYRQFWVDDDTGSNLTGDGSRDFPFRTITHAMSRVNGPRAVISVLPGLYSRSMHATEFEILPLTVKNGVEVEGFGAAGTIVVDGELRGGVFVYSNAPDAANRIENLVIERAGNPANSAASLDSAINVSGNTIVALVDITIRNGDSTGWPTALYVAGGATVNATRLSVSRSRAWADTASLIYMTDASTLRLDRSEFVENTMNDPAANLGAAIVQYGGTMSAINTTFVNNNGSGIRLRYAGTALLSHCTFAGNAYDGLTMVDRPATVHNSIFAFNGRYGVNEGVVNVEPIAFWNNLLFNNTQGNYRDEGGDQAQHFINAAASINAAAGANGRGTIVADPTFFSLPVPASNVRLRAGSPAINTAEPTVAPNVDKAGVVRPRGAGFDIGAFEF
jgi:hypothetical protein